MSEIIPQLELLRKRNAEREFSQTVREETQRIENLERTIRELDETMDARWCAKYDEMVLMHRQLAELESRMDTHVKTHAQGLPKALGDLVPLEKHVDLKVDLAKGKLKHSQLAVYSLKDAEGDVVARVFDTGREFDEDEAVRYVRLAIDEPSSIIALRHTDDGVRVEGDGKRAFHRQILDIEESTRSEVANSFRPALIDEGSVSEVRLPGEKVFLSLWMNPGCVFDMRDASGQTNPEVTLRGSGIVFVGERSNRCPSVKVKVEDTLKGQAPLVISLPDGISVGDIQYSPTSSTDFTLSVGNATFEQLGFRAEGRGHDVDVELKTPRGVQRIPVVRNGACILPGIK